MRRISEEAYQRLLSEAARKGATKTLFDEWCVEAKAAASSGGLLRASASKDEREVIKAESMEVYLQMKVDRYENWRTL